MKSHRSQFNYFLRTSLVFLVLGNGPILLYAHGRIPDSLAGGLIGFFCGIAIALALLGLIRNRRQCKTLAS